MIGTLQSPMDRIAECFSTASVTIPEGLVKLISQASGQYFSISRQIDRITGIVRSALAKPPGPVVSCPMMPNSSGIFSSWERASNPPTRNWVSTKSAPSRAEVLSREDLIFVETPAFKNILLTRPSIIPSFLSPSGISHKTISRRGNSRILWINPSISSGV